MATIDVKDAAGATVALERPLAPGQAARAASRPVTVATEDLAALLGGAAAHDAAVSGNPIYVAGKASAAAPTNVSADGDVVGAWMLRNGAAATVITAAGALVGGDATNGLDVDVTRVIPGTSATHLGKAIDTAAGATDTGVAALFTRLDTLATLTPASGDFVSPRTNARGAMWVAQDYTDEPGLALVTTTITRPANTTTYTVDDAYADTTPTAGGFAFLDVVRSTGKTCRLEDLVIVSSNPAATPLQGELFIFDIAVTAVADNAAFTVSGSDMLNLAARIPFALSTIGANSSVHLQNLGIGFKTVGNANLRFLVRVLNAYVPISAETLTFRAKFAPVN